LLIFIKAFGTVKIAPLQVTMNFRTLAAAQLMVVVLSGGIAIYLALCGFGVLSLVAKYVSNSLVYVAAIGAFSATSSAL
jgi:uncharacterized membrane protein